MSIPNVEKAPLLDNYRIDLTDQNKTYCGLSPNAACAIHITVSACLMFGVLATISLVNRVKPISESVLYPAVLITILCSVASCVFAAKGYLPSDDEEYQSIFPCV